MKHLKPLLSSSCSGLRFLTSLLQTYFTLSALTGTFVITDQDLAVNSGKGVYLKDLSVDPTDGFNPAADGVANLDFCPSIYADKRLYHLPNYRYLPPRNLPRVLQPEDDPDLILGSYPRLHGARQESWSLTGIMNDLSSRQKVEFNFEKTSKDNNILAQIMEFSQDGVDKLSIIDAGAYISEGQIDRIFHIFWVGKMLKDSEGVQTFMNIFSFVFEKPLTPNTSHQARPAKPFERPGISPGPEGEGVF